MKVSDVPVRHVSGPWGPRAGSETAVPLEFLAQALVHIPDQSRVTTRSDGWSANRPGGRWGKAEPVAARGTGSPVPMRVPAPNGTYENLRTLRVWFTSPAIRIGARGATTAHHAAAATAARARSYLGGARSRQSDSPPTPAD